MFSGLAALFIVMSIVGFVIWGVSAYSDEKTHVWIKGGSFSTLIIGIIFIILHFTITAQGARALKDFTSNTTGGLTRTVEVYDMTGKLIKTYDGKIDVKENEYGNKVLFDLNGKRTVIYNATVIVQEK
jgi:hypothetical protein